MSIPGTACITKSTIVVGTHYSGPVPHGLEIYYLKDKLFCPYQILTNAMVKQV